MNIEKYIRNTVIIERASFIIIPLILIYDSIFVDDSLMKICLLWIVAILIINIFYNRLDRKKSELQLKYNDLEKKFDHNYQVIQNLKKINDGKNLELQKEKNKYANLKEVFDKNYKIAKNLEQICADQKNEIQAEKDKYTKLKEIFDRNYQAATKLQEKNSDLQQQIYDSGQRNYNLYQKNREFEDLILSQKKEIENLEVKIFDYGKLKEDIVEFRKFEKKFKNSSNMQKLILFLDEIEQNYGSHVNFVLIREMLLELDNRNSEVG